MGANKNGGVPATGGGQAIKGSTTGSTSCVSLGAAAVRAVPAGVGKSETKKHPKC